MSLLFSYRITFLSSYSWTSSLLSFLNLTSNELSSFYHNPVWSSFWFQGSSLYSQFLSSSHFHFLFVSPHEITFLFLSFPDFLGTNSWFTLITKMDSWKSTVSSLQFPAYDQLAITFLWLWENNPLASYQYMIDDRSLIKGIEIKNWL